MIGERDVQLKKERECYLSAKLKLDQCEHAAGALKVELAELKGRQDALGDLDGEVESALEEKERLLAELDSGIAGQMIRLSEGLAEARAEGKEVVRRDAVGAGHEEGHFRRDDVLDPVDVEQAAADVVVNSPDVSVGADSSLGVDTLVLAVGGRVGPHVAANGDERHDVDRSYVSRIMKLAGLAPDIVQAILAGNEPDGLSPAKLRKALPLWWDWQRGLMGSPAL